VATLIGTIEDAGVVSSGRRERNSKRLENPEGNLTVEEIAGILVSDTRTYFVHFSTARYPR